MALKRRSQYGPILNKPIEPSVQQKPLQSKWHPFFPSIFRSSRSSCIKWNCSLREAEGSQVNGISLIYPLLAIFLRMLILSRLGTRNCYFLRKHQQCRNQHGIPRGNSLVLLAVTQVGFAAFHLTPQTSSLLPVQQIEWLRLVEYFANTRQPL